jgi:hypothetical protein
MSPFRVPPVLFTIAAMSAAHATLREDSSPPAFPDSVHVPNGCFLSTYAYLKRFRAEFPNEHGRELNIVARFADQRDQPHTLALVSWRGSWWLRDEHFGVFALGASAELHADSEELRVRAKSVTEKFSMNQVITGRCEKPKPPPGGLSPEQRLEHVIDAAEIIAEPSEVFLLQSGAAQLAFLFFRPKPGWIGVYDPVKGTATSECASRNGAAIVRAVAAKLGYAVGDISIVRGAGSGMPQLVAAE